jgi:(p)ppGpp synthase/HD superfamily hydrolase
VATLEKAIRMAAKAHERQVDKRKQPYILHPLRVMMRMETLEQKIVAVLHDTLEDTELTESDLEEAGFSEEIIAAVKALTRKKKPVEERYHEDFIPRVAKNRLAKAVKLADIADNLDPSRALPGTEGAAFKAKYEKARAILLKS